MAKVLHLDHVRALQRRAIASGAGQVTALGTVKWDIAGNCQSPHCTTMRGAERAKTHLVDPTLPWDVQAFMGRAQCTYADGEGEQWRPLRQFWRERAFSTVAAYLELWTRCRRCDKCLEQRGRLWRARARTELIGAPRTWFVTFTFSEIHRYQARLKARKLLAERGLETFEALPQPEQFMILHEVLARELTLMIKRLRKNTRARLRYLVVAEAHKDGFPHYHGLIHEHTAGTVTERDIRREWRGHGLGFCEAKLVDNAGRGAAYVCKYLTKSALARVRASQRYGQGWPCYLSTKVPAGTGEGKTPPMKARESLQDVSLQGGGPQGEGTGPLGLSPVKSEWSVGVSTLCTHRINPLSGVVVVADVQTLHQEVRWDRPGEQDDPDGDREEGTCPRTAQETRIAGRRSGRRALWASVNPGT